MTDVAGTHQDAIDTHYNKFGRSSSWWTRPGCCKKAKVEDSGVLLCHARAIKAWRNRMSSILMIDAQTRVEAQDMSLLPSGPTTAPRGS